MLEQFSDWKFIFLVLSLFVIALLYCSKYSSPYEKSDLTHTNIQTLLENISRFVDCVR